MEPMLIIVNGTNDPIAGLACFGNCRENVSLWPNKPTAAGAKVEHSRIFREHRCSAQGCRKKLEEAQAAFGESFRQPASGRAGPEQCGLAARRGGGTQQGWGHRRIPSEFFG